MKKIIISYLKVNVKLDENNVIIQDKVIARHKGNTILVSPLEIHYIDVSPNKLFLLLLLVFHLEHDDANRALMGANMQRQAIPLLVPSANCWYWNGV